MPTRRAFLQISGKIGMAVFTAGAFSGSARADAMGLPPGIQLYSVRNNMADGALATLTKLREIGYIEVETAGLGPYTAKEFRKMIEDAGLRVPSAHLKLTPTNFARFFQDANELGAKFAVSSSLETAMHPPVSSGTASGQRPAMAPLGPEEFKRLADAMNILGAKAKAAGLQYAYHNHNYEFVRMPDGTFGYDILVNGTDPDLVKFEIDCGWMCAGGADPVSYFRKYPGRIKMVHVKEFQPVSAPSTSLSGPSRPKGTDLGQGFIEYAPIFAAGKTAGVEHAFSEQEEPYPISQMASAKAAFRFLHAAS